jgi:hypothetical protein
MTPRRKSYLRGESPCEAREWQARRTTEETETQEAQRSGLNANETIQTLPEIAARASAGSREHDGAFDQNRVVSIRASLRGER